MLSDSLCKNYPEGIDYEWYGMDARGHVAVFTTAGSGPIPRLLLADIQATDRLAGYVWEMPCRGKATMLVSLPRPNDYLHFSGCGFFAYDWTDVHRIGDYSGKYELYSMPETPLLVTDLPSEFQCLLRAVTFQGTDFSASLAVDVRRFFNCLPLG